MASSTDDDDISPYAYLDRWQAMQTSDEPEQEPTTSDDEETSTVEVRSDYVSTHAHLFDVCARCPVICRDRRHKAPSTK